MHADGRSSAARAGGTVLSLLATPLTVAILRAHRDGPLRLPDLRERIGGAAQTTLRGQIGNLREIGALERDVQSGMPYTVVNALTPVGESILAVADRVEDWLALAPQGPIAFGSEAAKSAIRSLVAGWDSSVLRALAARPLSLTALDGVIAGLSYPSLERRLSAMRDARQIEPLPSPAGRAKPYEVTEWTRRAVPALVAACRCECEHFELVPSLTRVEIEAAFLLAVPLIDLDGERSGSCLLAVDTGNGGGSSDSGERIAGIQVTVENGVATCASKLDRNPQTWALGTAGSWVEAIFDGHRDGLRLGGEDERLATSLLEGLRLALRP